ncbi:amino acid adenylation domain-containing protein [Amycolatopsis sp. A133]|uniref:non-ribosomal peptide synthetase n=1 Tax=Amycolatopsis sp. A133 TaxID=3064472 RepID=UPI0027F95EA9|nr:amino acid adenylation domain-containing protein [Amycolatopsis sp. A133]MDQ7807552.1 amino acid adenylation domain-containing protein [Amycolatopsis sp. A133]
MTFPSSLSQRRLWFTEQLVPGTAVHHRCARFAVRGELDVPALERAVNDVVERHEALRTRFGVVDGVPVQEVLDRAGVTVRQLGSAAAVEEFAREPFDLGTTPPLRVGVVPGAALVFVLHHLVADTRSMDVFLREVAEHYRHDTVPDLPAPPVRYVDHATEERARVGTPQALEERAAQLAELAGFPTVLDLPADRPRPAVQTFAAAVSSWHVPVPGAHALEKVAREHGATLEMLLLTSFSVVLGLWSGQPRLLVATPSAGRPAEADQLIGSFANTLVIPVDLTADPSFATCLERVRDAYLNAASRDVPFEELVDGVAPERSLSHHPLVQVRTTVRTGPGPRLDLPGAGLEPVEPLAGTSPFDLELDVTLLDEGFEARLRYSTDLFEPVTAERFERHLRRLWDLAAADPGVRVEGIDLTDARERATLAELGTGPVRPVDSRALPARLAETARRHPGRVAVKAADGDYTHAQLAERAAVIGAELAARGLRPGEPAGVALPRGRDLPAGLLGVWHAGGAYVPLDPAYPRARLAHMTRDAGLKVLVSTRELADRIPVPDGTEVLLLDEPMSATPAARPVPDGGKVAYVIYTSGSTGRPKGVSVGHASLGNLLDDFAAETGFGADDRLLALTSLSFDIAGLELWLPLLTGGTLVVGPAGIGGDPDGLHRLLSDEDITVVQATPATWKLYTATTRVAPPALRQIWSGGEHLPHSLAQALTALGPEVHNLYGPTETTIWSTRAVLRPSDTVTGLGRPIANTSLFVTDAAGRPVPLGVPGELCIGGAGLALGYLGRPELTAERFTEVRGVPVYRTGDVVRWRSDGHLEYLGRLDDQVKIRGHRVEPGEVDVAVRACPGVRDACTVAVQDQLITFVTPATEPERSGSGSVDGATDDWRTLWDNTYAEGEPAAADDLDLKGWQSSYTKQPLPEPHMRDWISRTVERIAGTGARTFAEIGCGTGLLLLRLAPAAERYLGVDFSAKAVGHVAEAVARRGLDERVRLATATATQLGEVAAGERFDCVVLNSVAQYFPSRDYLTSVLAEASGIVAPGGHIFVGDLRSLRLAEAFHASVLRTDERLRTDELRGLAARAALEEDELLVDPGYFAALRETIPSITGIQVSLKAPGFDNELTRFRYDVLLRIGGERPERPAGHHDWAGIGDLAGLDRLLGAADAADVVVDGIPNARVARFAALLADDVPVPPWSLEDLEEIAARHGRRAHHAWSSRFPEQGRVRTTFGRGAAFVHEEPAIGGPVTNDPRQGALLRILKHRTRAFLRQRLPEYMVPNRVLTVPDLPLTPNGKTDRNALKALARQQTPSADHVAPDGPSQDLLHEVWCEVLGVSRVSVTENIFDAGTTSLLVVRIQQELRDRHGIDLPLTAFFAYPTISALAQVLRAPRAAVERAASPRTRNTTAARRRNHRRPGERR